MSERIFDPGLQPERTALAWRRTGLALTVGALVSLRILPEQLGPGALAIAAFGVVASIGILVAAHLRYRRVHRMLLDAGDRAPIGGAALLGALTAITLSAGVLGLVLVVVSTPRR